MASLVLLPGLNPALTHGEPSGEGWTYRGEQTAITVSLESAAIPGPQTEFAVKATVTEDRWDLWTDDFGNSHTEYLGTGPAVGATVNLAIDSGNGSLPSAAGSTDYNGCWSGQFRPGSEDSVVRATVASASGTMGSASISYGAETWTCSRTEGLVWMNLTAAEGTTDVPQGATRQVTAHVQYDSWEIWVSNFGSQRVENRPSEPAAYAAIYLSAGGADLSSSYLCTDADGNAQVTLTMNSTACTLDATTSWNMSTATASLAFSPPPPVEQWSYSHGDAAYSINISSASACTDVGPGEQRTIEAQVTFTTWEVWTSSFGNSENRNVASHPAANATVAFGVASGDGSVAASQVAADFWGYATTVFTMGSSASCVCATVGDSEHSPVTATLWLTPPAQEEWWVDHIEQAYNVVLTAPEGQENVPEHGQRQVVAGLTCSTWEVWHSSFGRIENRSGTTEPVRYASLSIVVSEGDGTLSSGTISTDNDGYGWTTLTMGAAASTISATVGSASASLTFTPPLVETWSKERDEATIWATVTSDGSTSDVPAQATRTVTVNVQGVFWEVWRSNLDHTEVRGERTGPAIGAQVVFSIAYGDGSVDTIEAETDPNGNAATLFTMGENECRVQADVSFAGTTGVISGSIDFSPEPWTYVRTDYTLQLSLSQLPRPSGASFVPVQAAASYQSWDIYANSDGGERHQDPQNGPAMNAVVGFWLNGDGAVSPSTATADSSGNVAATVTFFSSRVADLQASATFETATASAFGDIYPPPLCTGCARSDAGCPNLGCDCSGAGTCAPPPPNCGCGTSGCPTSSCTCNGAGGCGGPPPPQTCNGCGASGCPGTGCGCGGSGGCVTTTCNCGRSGCPGTGCACSNNCGTTSCNCANSDCPAKSGGSCDTGCAGNCGPPPCACTIARTGGSCGCAAGETCSPNGTECHPCNRNCNGNICDCSDTDQCTTDTECSDTPQCDCTNGACDHANCSSSCGGICCNPKFCSRNEQDGTPCNGARCGCNTAGACKPPPLKCPCACTTCGTSRRCNSNYECVSVDFEVVPDTWKVTVTPPDPKVVYSGLGTPFPICDIAKGNADTLDLQCSVKVTTGSTESAAILKSIAQQWTVKVEQDVIAGGGGKLKYGSGTDSYQASPIPGKDGTLRGTTTKQFQDINDTQLLLALDRPLLQGNFFYRDSSGAEKEPYDPTAKSLQSGERDDTFLTRVFVERAGTGEKRFLKWVRWKATWSLNFTVSYTSNSGITTVTLTPVVWEFRKIDEGDGQGPEAPATSPLVRPPMTWTP